MQKVSKLQIQENVNMQKLPDLQYIEPKLSTFSESSIAQFI